MSMQRRLQSCLAASLALSLPLTAVSFLAPQFRMPIARAANSASQTTAIQAIDLTQEGDTVRLAIALSGDSQPQVIFSQQGNAWVGNIANATLDLPDGSQQLRQPNPVPGVSEIEARQTGSDSVQIRVTGGADAPQGLLSERTDNQLIFDFEGLQDREEVANVPSIESPQSSTAQPSPNAGSSIQNETAAAPHSPAQSGAESFNKPTESGVYLENGLLSPIDTYRNRAAAPSSSGPSVFDESADPNAAAGSVSPEIAATPSTDPSVPTPITESNPTHRLTTAAAPPVGDIVTGDIILMAPSVELGSRELVTLTLKEAPVADVLSLLVRRAGLDVVLNDVPPGSTVSLDVVDSPLQTVFNSVLRLNELQAERVGRTIFIGQSLPGVQQKTLRTYRLNQAYVEDTTLGFGGVEPSIGEVGTVTGEDIEVVGILNTLEELAGEGGPFEGVEFYGDTRTNSVTAVGTPNQLDLVGAKIAQLDIRKRQAIIDFKLIDFNLGSDFDLDVNSFFNAGNFLGTIGPGGLFLDYDSRRVEPLEGGININLLIEDNRSKVLADPKVLVSDGGFTTIAIGDEVITNVEITTDPATLLTTETAVIGNAGVSLSVRNVRIDDNGFVSLDLSPQVSSPASQEQLGLTTITLLSQRTLNTQQIRLRDGQTFVLSGLIQDTDLVTVEKVPILGDIPLLGALFRNESTESDRREVVLLMTPHIVKE
ncbi:MAG: AMIN domain-containing protein [Synechococcus sp.]